MDPFANLKNPRQLVRFASLSDLNTFQHGEPFDPSATVWTYKLKRKPTMPHNSLSLISHSINDSQQPPTVLWNLFAYQTSRERKARHRIQKTLQPWNCRSSVSRELLPSCFSVERGYESSPIKASVLEKGFLCLFHRIFQCVQNRVRSGRGDWERWSVHFSTPNLKFKDATWTLNKR